MRYDILLILFYSHFITFVLTEALQLSGIVAILFSAVTARRYSNMNIPAEAKRATAFVFELMAYMSETAVFLYLGLDVFSKVIL
jgi:NhaP-type Na+/H+ or K+/H+ antiporter